MTIIASIGELDEIAEKIMQISTEALNRTIIKITEDQADRVYDYEISLVLVAKSE
ncbi:MAG: hypothetical protein QMD21_00500 [Candidatus Thermoplasmatota archaeon]|nr:hypothetical protein [Candidatus Thermoplasmatota archaeon]MDI6855251.1 hypothetical protein [Candidatus Thermoplasmatota archaeon]